MLRGALADGWWCLFGRARVARRDERREGQASDSPAQVYARELLDIKRAMIRVRCLLRSLTTSLLPGSRLSMLVDAGRRQAAARAGGDDVIARDGQSDWALPACRPGRESPPLPRSQPAILNAVCLGVWGRCWIGTSRKRENRLHSLRPNANPSVPSKRHVFTRLCPRPALP